MSYKDYLVIIMPSIFSWLLASLLLLIYSFDIIYFVESSPANPFAGWGVLILGIILVIVILVLYFTGVLLDQKPIYLRILILVGMVGSSIMVILFVILIKTIFVVIALAGLALFFGILLTSSGTLFAGLTDMWKRGQTYSSIIFIFILFSLTSILLGGLISHQAQQSDPQMLNPLSYSWMSILPGIGVLGLIMAIIFLFVTRNMEVSWVQDAWPTKFKRIIERRSVRAYLITHFCIYLMLGIVIAGFPKIGETIASLEIFSFSINIPNLGTFDPPLDKLWWFIVLVGDLIGTIPAGYFADRNGRKNLIITAIYGIVFSALIFGLERSPESFFIAAFIIGVSFALLHSTLDSSLWADLSPRDGLGRYYALGFISLALGLGVGSGLGHWVLSDVEVITYLLIILAILAAFPLFWVSDSYKPLDFSLLLVIEEGGLPIFDYSFQKKLDVSVELTLLSGALTAVSSFMSETLKEKGELNLVRHGSHFILTDRLGGIAAAVFSNKQDPELRKSLHEFLVQFCEKFSTELKTWNGTRSLFDGAVELAEEVFGHLAPSINLED
ncbi:MAG: MFS transporter [Candidatus Hodarchaeota archaeon]